MPSRVGRSCSTDAEDYHARINDPSLGIDEHTLLVIRGVGPIGYPGAAGGGQHAATRRAPGGGHRRAAVHRGRAPVGHVRVAVDPQRVTGGGRGRRPGTAADRRSGAHRPAPADRRRAASRTRSWRRDAPSWMRRWPTAACRTCRPARRRGRRSSGAWSTSWTEGMVLKPAVKYQDIAHGPHSVPRDNH